MDAALLSLARWDVLTPAQCEEVARDMARRLPPPFVFAGIETHTLGTQRHRITFFDWNGRPFALIPGGRAVLGYDRQHPFIPTAAQLESWEWTCAEYAGYVQWATSLDAYLDEHLTPLRTVILAPFLMEVSASIVGRVPWFNGRYRLLPVRQPEVVVQAAADGFRLPTPDEWEYACAGGSRTLFRWGNDCPVDHYPHNDDEEYAWALHRRPNAFGLHIASYPYHWEFTTEPWEMRGGDGGHAICGGEGGLVVWTTLASAYRWPCGTTRFGNGLYRAYLRRVYPLTRLL